MKEQHLWQLLEGLGTSLQLTAASLLVGCILSLLMTVSLVMRTPVVHWFSRAVITLFYRHSAAGANFLGVLRPWTV